MSTPDPMAPGPPPEPPAWPPPPPPASSYPSTSQFPPPPAQPAPTRRAPMLVVVGAVVLALLVAGGVAFVVLRPKGSSDQAGPSSTRTSSAEPTPSATTRTTTAAPTPEFTGYQGEVADLLLPRPSGSQPATSRFFEPGMSNMQRFLALWNPDSPEWMKGVLTTNRYQNGADVEWFQGPDFVAIVLLQFERPSGAQGWQFSASTRGFTGAAATGSAGDGKYAVLNLPDGSVEIIGVFTKFEFGIYVDVTTGSRAESLSKMTALAAQQSDRITA